MKKRYYIPANVNWNEAVPEEERSRLQQAVMDAIRRAVGSTAGEVTPDVMVTEFTVTGDSRELFATSRYRVDRDTYAVPSYNQGGATTEVPVEDVISFEEGEAIVSDRVIEKEPPFQGATVLALPGNHYVRVSSHHYATTSNIGRAYEWGRTLFGAESWVITAGQGQGFVLYMIAALDEPLTEADLHIQPLTASNIPGAAGIYRGKVLETLPRDYSVVAVGFRGGGFSAPSTSAFLQFVSQVKQARQEGSTSIETGEVKAFVFAPIDALITQGGDENLEKAAKLLAELNAAAFAKVPWSTLSQYLEVLIDAWTKEPQEVAIVEIIKSIHSQTELQAIFQKLRDAELWDQLFTDMDKQLWSMLVVLGQRFGDPFSFKELIQLMLEAKLMVAPGIRLGPNGPEISVVDLSEIEEAAWGFVRFIGDMLESLWMMVSHPEKIIEGVGQLVKMIVMVKLADLGYPPAQQFVDRILRDMSQQVIFGLRGAHITGMASRIVNRIKWAIIWEVASWFVGVGEIRTAIRGIGITERLGALARILRVLGLAGRAVEGEQIAAKFSKLAQIMRRSSRLIHREEDLLRLISHLPEEEVGRLSRLLETIDVDEALDLSKLAKLHPELGEAATHSLRKAEALGQFAAKAGGLSDEVAEAFTHLSGGNRLSLSEVTDLINAIPQRQGAHFARAVRNIPETALGISGEASGEFLRAIAQHPSHMNALTNIGYDSFRALYRRAGGKVETLDQYLVALTDLELALSQKNRATDFRRLLDKLAEGEETAWQELNNARRSRFGFQEERLDPATIDRWIEEELQRGGGVQPLGADPIQIPSGRPRRPQVSNLRDVDLSDLTPAQRAQYQQRWQNYQGPLQTLDDYIRFQHGLRTRQLQRGRRMARELGEVGEIERRAGYILQDVVNAHLPAGSANSRDIPTRFGSNHFGYVRPDHLPPGQNTVRLDKLGRRTQSSRGTPFSAQYVADSKYRDAIPSTEQTRGLAYLARHSDERRLIFYVRWKEEFPAATSLTRGPHNTGHILPGEFVPQLVAPTVRDEASRVGIQIQLVSDPLWK